LSEKQIAGVEEFPRTPRSAKKKSLSISGLDDVILDLSILPNRPDMYAIMNIAREIGCLSSTGKLTLPEPKKISSCPQAFEVGSPRASARNSRFVKSMASGLDLRPAGSKKFCSERRDPQHQ
jgi:phenylalanyl-tRNA synthetase beta subunit